MPWFGWGLCRFAVYPSPTTSCPPSRCGGRGEVWGAGLQHLGEQKLGGAGSAQLLPEVGMNAPTNTEEAPLFSTSPPFVLLAPLCNARLAQGPPPGQTTMFPLKTLSNNHPLVERGNMYLLTCPALTRPEEAHIRVKDVLRQIKKMHQCFTCSADTKLLACVRGSQQKQKKKKMTPFQDGTCCIRKRL